MDVLRLCFLSLSVDGEYQSHNGTIYDAGIRVGCKGAGAGAAADEIVISETRQRAQAGKEDPAEPFIFKPFFHYHFTTSVYWLLYTGNR